MKDSRVVIWTNTQTHATGSTTNTGPTIDFYAQGAVTGTADGPGHFGAGGEIIQTWVSGVAQVTVWEWEVSSDAVTWRKGAFIGASALVAAGYVRFKSALRTRYRYGRLLATNSGTGASTSVAYAEDMGDIPSIAVSNA